MTSERYKLMRSRGIKRTSAYLDTFILLVDAIVESADLDWRIDMRYATNCIDSNFDDITAMTDAAINITRRTFLKHVDQSELADIAEDLGYCWHHKQGLTMAADHCVTYHRSKFKNRRCYYFRWSAIEYIFT